MRRKSRRIRVQPGQTMLWEPMQLGELCGVRAVGEVTSAVHMEALAVAAERLIAGDLTAQVIHYDRCRLVLTPQQMADNVLAASRTLGPLTVPTALVVAPDQFEHWQVYTQIMGARGVLRGVFTGPEASERAQRWAHEMAQVAAVMRAAWRQPSPPCSEALRIGGLSLHPAAR